MKITFRRSGGFAPRLLGLDIDTDSAEAAESEKLRRLVEESGILGMSGAQQKGARDVNLYHFEIESDQGIHKVTFDQLSIPDTVKPLVKFFNERARDLMPET